MTEARLKHLAEVRISNVDKKSIEGDPLVLLCNYTDAYYNDRITGSLDFMSATATPDQRAVFALKKGDVVLTKDSETADDIAETALVTEDIATLVCGYHLAVIRPRSARAIGSYIRWTLASMPARQALGAAATGVTRFGLRSEAIENLLIPVIPISTQRAIADYLDRETARIDGLIDTKRRMVKLEVEHMQGLRESAFSNAPAPEVRLGRFVTSIGQGVSPAAEARQVEDYEWGVLKLSAVKRGRFVSSEHKALPSDFAPDPRMVPRAGDLLVTRANTPDLVGDVCAVTIPRPRLILCDLIYVLRLRPDLDPEYAAQALLTQNARAQLSSVARGTSQSMVKLRAEDVKGIVIRVPDLGTQRSIVETLNQASVHCDLVVSKLQRSITLLQERRQALITAAVTGQLNIAEAA